MPREACICKLCPLRAVVIDPNSFVVYLTDTGTLLRFSLVNKNLKTNTTHILQIDFSEMKVNLTCKVCLNYLYVKHTGHF